MNIAWKDYESAAHTRRELCGKCAALPHCKSNKFILGDQQRNSHKLPAHWILQPFYTIKIINMNGAEAVAINLVINCVACCDERVAKCHFSFVRKRHEACSSQHEFVLQGAAAAVDISRPFRRPIFWPSERRGRALVGQSQTAQSPGRIVCPAQSHWRHAGCHVFNQNSQSEPSNLQYKLLPK